MGVYGGPNVSEDGLVLALDGANYKSFKGESVTNLYYADAASSANNSIFHMPMGGTATGSYTTSSYGSWSGNTIFKVIVSAGTLSGGYESFRACVSGSFTSTYGTSRRLSAKVKMLKGSITSLGLHNGGGTSGHSSGHYTPISEFSVPTDVLSKDGWYQFDVDVSGSYPSGHCVGIGIVGSDIEFLVTEMMLYPSLTFVRFTPTTRGTTVATGGGWADLTGNGNNGELVNGVRESSANGGSLSFDGTNDYVILTRNDFNTSLPNFTISVFVYKISDGIILGNHRHNQTWESVWISTTQFTVNDANGTANRQTLDYTTPINSWMNLVAVNNSSQNYMKVFLNGAEIATKTATVIPWNSSIIPTIGANLLVGDLSPVGPINGRIANTQIYNRALTAAEISQNFIATRSRYGI